MLIEIKGVQFVNKGAELMLHAVQAKIEALWPDAEIALAPNPNSPYASRARVGALQKFPLRKGRIDLNGAVRLLPARLRRFLRTGFGIVFEADIDLVLDASGFGYGDAWGVNKSRQLATELKRCRQRGADYVLLPQAFGPFRQQGHQGYLKPALPQATLICARENTSAGHIMQLLDGAEATDVTALSASNDGYQVRDNLYVFPDFTNLVTGHVPDYFQAYQSAVLIIPNNTMVGERNHTHQAWKAAYIEVMCAGVQAALDLGYQPILLNHEGPADRALCTQINAAFDNQLVLIEEPCPLAVKGMIGASKAVVCSRFHGCVSALSQGVACLGTSWNHKYESLFAEYQRSDYLLRADVRPDELRELLQSAIANIDDAGYQATIEHFKLQSAHMWQQVAKHVG